MSQVYKLIHPIKYFNDYIDINSRVDGRSFQDQRNVRLHVNSLKTAEASAVVKCGNTTVACGIQLELATPKAEAPDIGFMVPNIELTPLCSSKCRPGPPSDHAQITSNIVSKIISNSKCIDLKDLCIVPDKLAWVLYCDMICLDNDGSLVDSCLISLMASLKTLTLPKVDYDEETEEINVDTSTRTPLKINGLPVATSFGVYNFNQRVILLADPTAYEEEMCGGIGANLVICYNNGNLCGIQKFGGSNILEEAQEESFVSARQKAKCIEDMINICIKNESNKNK